MKALSIGLLLCISINLNAQNVGIGLINPTVAKLEVFGVMGTGLTAAAFGIDGAGISIQRKWPGIGFNQYQDNVSPGKFMATGSANILYLDLINESFNFYELGFGDKNQLTNEPQQTLTFFKTGSVNIGKLESTNYSLWVARNYSDVSSPTAIFAGTNYKSDFAADDADFSNGNPEDTHINGGKAGSKVYINDVLNGNTLIGGTTDISEVNPPTITGKTILNVEGAIAFTKRDDFEICNAGVGAIYTPGNSSYVSVKRIGCTISQPFVIANGIADGQLLIVQIEGNNDFTIYSQNNIFLKDGNNRVVGGGDIMTLYWNAYSQKWLQLMYSNN